VVILIAIGAAWTIGRAGGHQGERAIAVGATPIAVAVDASARRVFVVDAGPLDTARGFVGPSSVHILDADSGLPLRRIATDTISRQMTMGFMGGGIAVDELTGRVFVTNANSSTNSVSVIDACSDELVQRLDFSGGMSSIAVDERANRAVTVATRLDSLSGGTVGVLDARTGSALPIPPQAWSYIMTTEPLAMDNAAGRVFLLNDNPTAPGLSVLDTRTGRLLHETWLGMSNQTSPPSRTVAVDTRSGHVFAAYMTGANVSALSLLDAQNGHILRTISLGPVRPSASSVDEQTGRLFLATASLTGYTGRVMIFDTATGRLLGATTVGANPVTMAVDTRRGRVYVITTGGVVVLHARSGMVLRTISMTPQPVAVAIDRMTGHAFIINAGETIYRPNTWTWMPQWLRSWLPFLPSSMHTETVPPRLSILTL